MALDGIRDLDIRASLRSTVEQLHDPSETRILDELEICQGNARADLAVVNGVLHGYEIKSDADSLSRLPRQVAAYSRVFERVTIVCSRKHLISVRGIVPKWWGILVAEGHEGAVRFVHIRRDQRNPSIDFLAQAQLLWRDEVIAALEDRGLADGLRHKPRRMLWQQLASHRPNDVSAVVRQSLKARQHWRVPALQA